MSSQVTRLKKKLIQLEQSQGHKLAIIYIVTGLTVFTIAQVLVKGSTLSVFQTLYIRGLMICCFNLTQKEESFYILEKQERNLLLLQAFFSSLESFLYFIGMRLLSISEATTLYLTYSLWTQFQASCILKEPISSTTMRNCAISLIGVMFITKPSALLNFFSNSVTDDHLTGCIVMITASIIYGFSQILLRQIYCTSIVKLHYYHGWNIVLGALANVCLEDVGIEMYNLRNLIIITIISITSYIAHTLFIKAYSMVSIAKLAPYTFSQIITALLCDFLIFQKLPDTSAVFGSALVILSVVLSIIGQKI